MLNIVILNNDIKGINSYQAIGEYIELWQTDTEHLIPAKNTCHLDEGWKKIVSSFVSWVH